MATKGNRTLSLQLSPAELSFQSSPAELSFQSSPAEFDPGRTSSAGRRLAGVNRQLSLESPLVGGLRFAAGDIGGQVRILAQMISI
jgi:hypothetical protein